MGESPPDALIPTVNILLDVALLSSTGNDQCALLRQLGDVSQPSVQSSVQSDLSDLVYITDGLPPIPKKLYQKIEDWQFVNLHDLLFNSAKGQEEENNVLQQCDGESVAAPIDGPFEETSNRLFRHCCLGGRFCYIGSSCQQVRQSGCA